jgi:hypothetical protein
MSYSKYLQVFFDELDEQPKDLKKAILNGIDNWKEKGNSNIITYFEIPKNYENSPFIKKYIENFNKKKAKDNHILVSVKKELHSLFVDELISLISKETIENSSPELVGILENLEIKNGKDFVHDCCEIFNKGVLQKKHLRTTALSDLIKYDVIVDFLCIELKNIIEKKIKNISFVFSCEFDLSSKYLTKENLNVLKKDFYEIKYKEFIENKYENFVYLCKLIDDLSFLKKVNSKLDFGDGLIMERFNNVPLWETFVNELNYDSSKIKEEFKCVFMEYEDNNSKVHEPYYRIINKKNHEKLFNDFKIIHDLYTPKKICYFDYYVSLAHAHQAYKLEYFIELMTFFEIPANHRNEEIHSLVTLEESLKSVPFFYFYFKKDFEDFKIKTIKNNDVSKMLSSDNKTNEEKLLMCIRKFRNKYIAHKDIKYSSENEFKDLVNFIEDSNNELEKLVEKIIEMQNKILYIITGKAVGYSEEYYRYYKECFYKKDIEDSQFTHLKDDLLFLIELWFDKYSQELLDNLCSTNEIKSPEMFKHLNRENICEIFNKYNIETPHDHTHENIFLIPNENFCKSDAENIEKEIKDLINNL